MNTFFQDVKKLLEEHIARWHRDNMVPLVGKFEATVWAYIKAMMEPPPRPFWTYTFTLEP